MSPLLTVVLQTNSGCGQKGPEHLEEDVERQLQPRMSAQNTHAQRNGRVQMGTLGKEI